MSVLTPENIRYESLDPNPSVLTPSSIASESAPDKVYSDTKSYGETVSTLVPGYEAEVKKYEGVYKVKIPEEVLNICHTIYGLGGRALLVGGSVRDAIISTEFPERNLKPKDFDLEIYGISSDHLKQILAAEFGGNSINTAGRAYGTVKVRPQGWSEDLDFSIPRRDSKTQAGHTGFLVTGDPTMRIDEASLRRDLTMNSIAYDPLSEILYDPYGGVEDIKRQVIEVTDTKAFQEDPLRVMRVMQFSSRFEFSISEETFQLCSQMVERGSMDELPRERIREEMLKLLTMGLRPSIGLEFAQEVGFVKRYWPELDALVGLQQDAGWHPEGDAWVHTMQTVDAAADIARREIQAGRMEESKALTLVSAALCHDLGKGIPDITKFEDGAIRSRGHEEAGVEPTREFLERIFKNQEAKSVSDITREVLPLVANHLRPKEMWKTEIANGIDQTNAITRLANRLSVNGNTSIYMLSLLAEADQRGRNGQENIFLTRDQVPELEEWQSWLTDRSKDLKVDQKPSEVLLSGEDLLAALGIEKNKGGPWLGVVLKAVRADQLDGNVTTPDYAVTRAKAYWRTLTEKVEAESTKTRLPEAAIWRRLRGMEDPRIYLAPEKI